MLKTNHVSEAVRSQRDSMTKREKRDRVIITLVALGFLLISFIITLKVDRYFHP